MVIPTMQVTRTDIIATRNSANSAMVFPPGRGSRRVPLGKVAGTKIPDRAGERPRE